MKIFGFYTNFLLVCVNRTIIIFYGMFPLFNPVNIKILFFKSFIVYLLPKKKRKKERILVKVQVSFNSFSSQGYEGKDVCTCRRG